MFATTPLAGPESRWAATRSWLFVLRWAAALVVLSVVLTAGWYCWFRHHLNPSFLPGPALRVGFTVATGFALALVLLLTPAVLAGAFAGSSQQGELGMLLCAQVSAGEIVFSRFLSRLAQVAMALAAALPALCFLAAYCGGFAKLSLALALLTAVGFGYAGIAVALSVMFIRARDALIAAYVIGLLFMSLPALLAPPLSSSAGGWIDALNPFAALVDLIYYDQFQPAWRTLAVWLSMTPVGLLLASYLLRPAYLRRTEGKSLVGRRRHKVPPLEGCPIRWKELHIEANKDFGRLVRHGSRLALALLLGGSSLLLACFLWTLIDESPPHWVSDILQSAAVSIPAIAQPMSWLLQWGVGVRAAASIASEKEQGAWDALLMTPLEGTQIVSAKMIESCYALRWFLVAAVFVWCLAVMLEAFRPAELVWTVCRTAAYIGFMAAVGVWSSLTAKTSARAIALTIVCWLVGKIAFNIAAALLVLAAMLLYLLFWAAVGIAAGNNALVSPPTIMSFQTAMSLFELTLCSGATILIAWYCHSRFDRLAGRCPVRTHRLRPATARGT